MLSGRATWQRVEAALSDGTLVGSDEIERHETHMSIVVMAGEVVYKLKKPVVFEFADYGSASKRLEMCRAEIDLNRRLAPRLYLGLAAVVEEGGRLRLVEGEQDDALEHVVLMQRVAEQDLLYARLLREDVAPELVREIGRTLAAFHIGAAMSPAGAWSVERVRTDLAKRFELLRTEIGEPLDLIAIDAIERYLGRWLETNGGLIEERARAGWVREGHGDLRREHVVLDDPVQVIDCVEFDRRLRDSDVLSDLAFLVMELEYAGRHDLAEALYRAWANAGGPLDERLLWGYAAMRALIRVEVALLRVEQLGDQPPREDKLFRTGLAIEHAQALLELAEQLTWRDRTPTAILLGGLSGSGKSTIAAYLARRWGLERLSSDHIRKQALGLRISEVAPAQAYEDTVSLYVYETLGRRAGAHLERGASVIVDATFRRTADSEVFQAGMAQATTKESNVLCVGLTAAPDVLRERISVREREGGSDATLEVLDRQLVDCPSRLPVFPGLIAVSSDGMFADVIREIDRIVLDRTMPATPGRT